MRLRIKGNSVLAVLVAAIALLVAAPTALATVNYTGKTTQGNDFTLRTADDGITERASYGWDMNCKGGGTLTNGGTVSRFPDATVNGFKGKGKYESVIENKFLGTFKVRIDGERQSDTRFTGSFKLSAKIVKKRNGDPVTKCSTGIVRWTADAKAPVTPPVPRAAPGDFNLR